MILFLFTLIFSSPSHSAQVLGADYNHKLGAVEVKVQYAGGCKVHKFSLQRQACRETFPVSCDLDLIHDRNGDTCKALITETLSFSLAEAGVRGSYFTRAELIIRGDGGSRAVVRLPAME